MADGPAEDSALRTSEIGGGSTEPASLAEELVSPLGPLVAMLELETVVGLALAVVLPLLDPALFALDPLAEGPAASGPAAELPVASVLPELEVPEPDDDADEAVELVEEVSVFALA